MFQGCRYTINDCLNHAFIILAPLMTQITPYPIGMESGEITASQITASTEQSPYHRANQARLNNVAKGKNIGAWSPKKHNDHQWLQVDMQYERKVVQISTQVFTTDIRN